MGLLWFYRQILNSLLYNILGRLCFVLIHSEIMFIYITYYCHLSVYSGMKYNMIIILYWLLLQVFITQNYWILKSIYNFESEFQKGLNFSTIQLLKFYNDCSRSLFLNATMHNPFFTFFGSFLSNLLVFGPLVCTKKNVCLQVKHFSFS